MDNSTLILNTSKGKFIIEFNSIIRIEASSNYSKIYFYNALGCLKWLVVAKVLKWFEEKLPYEHFTRLHRSHLVNNQFLKTYPMLSNAFVMQNGNVIEVSRRRRKLIKSKFLLAKQ